MHSIQSEISQFIAAREETITTLKKIKSEIDDVGKTASNTNLATSVVSLGAGIASAVCVVATPFTAGASAPVAVGMAVLSGTSAAVSVGTTLVKHFKESGLMKTASEVIVKDQRAKERLQAAAKTIRALASVSTNSFQALEKAAQLGLTTTTEVHKILQLSGTAKATEIAAKTANIMEKVNKVAKITGPVLVFMSIPFDIMSIVAELLSKGNVSEASKQIEKKIHELQNEYQTVRNEYDQVKSVLNK